MALIKAIYKTTSFDYFLIIFYLILIIESDNNDEEDVCAQIKNEKKKSRD